MRKLKLESGQIVLILVLITVVGLTIGLSLVSRTITDVRISSQIEQSGRAFSAAEAGIEQALRGSFNLSQTEGTVTLNGASATYSIENQGGTSGQLTFPMTSEGDIQTLWLIDHNPDGTLNEAGYSFPTSGSFDLCWGSSVTNQAAVSLALLYNQDSSYKIANSSYDGLSRGNNFVLADSAGGYCDGSFRFKKTIVPESEFSLPFGSILIALRLSPVYAGTALAVSSGEIFPLQKKVITSTGQTATSIARTIQVHQGFSELPKQFDFTLITED